MRYVYSLIRFVPDPFRGEFINVGAVVGSDESSEWAVRQVENPLRARQLDQAGALSAAWAFVDDVGREIDAYEEVIAGLAAEAPVTPTESWLDDLHLRMTNVVQLSPPAVVVAESVEAAVETVFSQWVVDPAKRAGGTTKHPALAALRRAYRDAHVPGLLEGGVLEAGEHQERLDFSVANGRVVQITQAWSFAVADQESLAKAVRAWGYTVRAAQGAGGTLHVGDTTTLRVPRDFDVEVVAIPPRDGADAPALRDARAVFRDIRARERTLADAPQVALRATELLSAGAH